ncbi:hypothetical protein [Zavarzinia sp.]|uniref:hypothetical protein n=1 Tax=Zavarzinia sp. TaxID=2027920 RepID=UPI00356482DA
MITVVHNQVQDAIEVHLDERGAGLLIARLKELLAGGDHAHVYLTEDDAGLSSKAPYGEGQVYREIIINLLPAEAWTE